MINHLAYNSCLSNLTVCTDTGYILYNLSPTLEKKTIIEMGGGLGLMRLLDKTNLSLNIGGGNFPYKPKNKIILWDEYKKRCLLEIGLKDPIKNIHLARQRIISITEKTLNIFDWSGNLLFSHDTYCNEKGLCAISNPSPDNLIIATLGAHKGEISIYKKPGEFQKNIQAHITNIETLAINSDGTYVVTASEIGTIIRIFNIDTGQMEYEFRRGTSSAKIYDLVFNQTSTLLACYSGNGTIHMFELYEDIKTTKNTISILADLKNYLPNYFSSQWAFKQIHTSNNIKGICGFDSENNLHITLYDGHYYKIKGINNNFNIISEGNLSI